MKQRVHSTHFLATIITLFLCGCEKNVTIELPVKTPKLVINAFGYRDSVFSPYIGFFVVGKSRGILEPLQRNDPNWQDLLYVKDAVFLLYANDVLFDTIRYDTAKKGYSQNKFFNGKVEKYTIKGGAPGFLPIEATSSVLEPIPIKITQYKQKVRKKKNGDLVDEITIAFSDPGNEKNFYRIDFFSLYAGNFFGKNCFFTKDADIDEVGRDFDPFADELCLESVTLNDNNFDGAEKRVTFEVLSEAMKPFTDPQTGIVSFPKVVLEHLTENHYRYINSIAKYNDTRDNPFAEPVSAYTNIKNGYGIFTILTGSSQDIK
jgi:Domain of unknown function (DUF4249)